MTVFPSITYWVTFYPIDVRYLPFCEVNPVICFWAICSIDLTRLAPVPYWFNYYSYWRGSEHATPKYATLAYWLFWAEGTWETADARMALRPPPFYLKASHKISQGNDALPEPGREEHSYSQRLEVNTK